MGFQDGSELGLGGGFLEDIGNNNIALNTQSHKEGSQCDCFVHHDFGSFFR